MGAIRAATVDDVRGVLEFLGREWSVYSNPADSSVEQWKRRIGAGERLVWVTAEEHALAGVVVLKPLYHHKHVGGVKMDVEVEYLVVDRALRRKCVGTRLEEFVVAEASRRGFKQARLDVELERAGSVDFWRRRGWIDAGEIPQENSHTLTMTKSVR